MIKLTERQNRFCEEYVIDLNATRAYREAYPHVKSEGTARSNSSRLLTNANIQNRISELQRERSERTGITADTVLKELEKIALTDTEISSKEKMKALELLGKHLGMFTGEVNNNLIDDNIRKDVERLVKVVRDNDKAGSN